MGIVSLKETWTRGVGSGNAFRRGMWRIGTGFAVGVGLYVSYNTLTYAVFTTQHARIYAKAHPAEARSCMVYADPDVHSYTDWGFAPLLARADPEGYAYLESHPVFISFVDEEVFADCQPGQKGSSSFSLTLGDTGVILLNDDKLPDDRLVAAAVSHELVHVRYGDLSDPASRRSMTSQFFWLSEEADAHLHGMKTGRLLGATGMPNRFTEYCVFVFPAMPWLVSFGLLGGFCEWKRKQIPSEP